MQHRQVLIAIRLVEHIDAHAGPEAVVVGVGRGGQEPGLIIRGERQRRATGGQRQGAGDLSRAVAHAGQRLARGRVAADPRHRRGSGRQPVAEFGVVVRCADLAGGQQPAARRDLIGAHPLGGQAVQVGIAEGQHPVQPAQLEGAGVADAEAAGVAHGVHRNQGGQVRRALQRQSMLRAADVGRADHAALTVRPGLRGDPGQQIGAVRAVVAERPPAPFRAVATTHILHDHGVAMGDEGDCEGGGAAEILAVRSSGDDGGKASLRDRFTVAGQEDIGRQAHAIAHLDHQVAALNDRGRGCHAAGPATLCSIAPKIERPSAPSISIRTRSPALRNGVFGAPWRRVSTVRSSARHE